ncbi:hypothetical protein [Microcoleus anatoxicus]|uniref:Uncharacterized protein n=1 Tax=Microcoleus anatoxicus PTRS2 TaxID=2705321 RepID=A0ABU8YQ87_9CYAN
MQIRDAPFRRCDRLASSVLQKFDRPDRGWLLSQTESSIAEI